MSEVGRPYRMGRRGAAMERTRTALVESAAELFLSRPYEQVTLAAIAGGAGVSVQTLLNHFVSKEGVLMSAIDALSARVHALRGDVAPGDVQAAVDALVGQYEKVGDLNVHALQQSGRFAELEQLIAVARADHLAWLERTFDRWLPAPSDATARRRTLQALYAVTDVGAWKLLRRDLGNSRVETARILRLLLDRVLVEPKG